MPDPDPCPRPDCGLAWDDHTMRLLREHHPANELNLPYEPVPGGPVYVEGLPGALCGALTVRAATMESPGAPGAVPALLFTFYGTDGRTVAAEASLVLDPAGTVRIGKVIRDTANAAANAARADGRWKGQPGG